jgi:tetratricopeptide (TPR) repeat protein
MPNFGGGRPNVGAGSRPNFGGGGRPAGGNFAGMIPQTRPGGGAGGIGNRPNMGNLPGISQQPGGPGGIAVNRPGLIPQGGRPSQLPANGGRPGGVTRPGSGLIAGNRPGAGGGGEQWRPGGGGAGQLPTRPGGGDGWRPGDNNRPGWGNRPGAGGGGEEWRPGDNNRPGWRPGDNDRPGWANRPGGGGNWAGWRPGDNNRPNWGNNNRPNWGNNNNSPIVNRPDNSNNTNINNQQYYGGNTYASGYRGYGAYGGYGYPGYGGYGSLPYYGSGYTDWYHGSWSDWSTPLAAWTTAAAANSALGWLSAANSFAYSNPYYVAPATTIVQPVYDYAEPIPVQAPPDTVPDTALGTYETAPQPAATDVAPTVIAPSAAAAPEAAPALDPKTKAAMDSFAAARDAFKAGDYARAQAEIDKGIALFTGDPVMHEFRALTLFAQGKYQEAAATLYAVLARGPGWDWDTMRSLYPDTDTYTRQLRALEAYVREHLTDSAARFVLAYQYLVTRQTDAAIRQLQEVVKLTPANTLAADMLKALTTPQAGAAPPPPAGQ